jgi:hypothetical protein
VGDVNRAVTWLVVLAVAKVASAEPPRPAPAQVAVAPDPPRWRIRAALTQGVGGGKDGPQIVTVFPTTLEFGARIWGPLSVTVAASGVWVGSQSTACGKERRANAGLGSAGLRVDFGNGLSKSWVAPFIEVHGGVGGQGGGPELDGVCPAGGVFGTGGARVGFDVWLGKAAVTIVAAYDYLPHASPFSLALGGTFRLF